MQAKANQICSTRLALCAGIQLMSTEDVEQGGEGTVMAKKDAIQQWWGMLQELDEDQK